MLNPNSMPASRKSSGRSCFCPPRNVPLCVWSQSNSQIVECTKLSDVFLFLHDKMKMTIDCACMVLRMLVVRYWYCHENLLLHVVYLNTESQR